MKFRPEKSSRGLFSLFGGVSVEASSLAGNIARYIVELDEPFGLALAGFKVDAGLADGGARVHGGQLADHRVGGINARLGFCGAGLWAAAKPLDLRSDLVAQALLLLALRFQVSLLLFKKAAEVSFHAQKAFSEDAVQLNDLA